MSRLQRSERFIEPCKYLVFKEDNKVHVIDGLSGVDKFASTIDGAAINWALSNLTANRNWQERVLARGAFTISTTIMAYGLSLPSYTILQLDGLVKAGDSVGGTFGIDLVHTADTLNGNSFSEVVGGVWDANKDGNPFVTGPWNYGAKNGMYFMSFYNLYIHDLTIKNAAAVNLHIDCCTSYDVMNVRLLGPGYHSVHNGSNGPHPEDNNANYINCVIEGPLVNPSLIKTADGGAMVGGASIMTCQNVHIPFSYAQGLNIGGYANRVIGCLIENVGANGIGISGNDCVAMGNIIRNSGTIGTIGMGIAFGSGNNSRVIGNMIYDCVRHGVYAYSGENLLISDNYIHNSGTIAYAGITITTSGGLCNAHDNFIRGFLVGVKAEGKSITIKNNRVFGSGSLSIYSTGNYNIVKDNDHDGTVSVSGTDSYEEDNFKRKRS